MSGTVPGRGRRECFLMKVAMALTMSQKFADEFRGIWHSSSTSSDFRSDGIVGRVRARFAAVRASS